MLNDQLKTFLSATSVNVEHIFSRGHLLLSHVCSQLSAQSIRALLCLGSWSRLGLVKDTNVLAVTLLDNVEGDEEPLLGTKFYCSILLIDVCDVTHL
ncbi:hypothetical protein L208DRAFT_1259651 [Tricholoma matsutake]|nr:hypothetical protein L208DRAFT_1259651 [Tricholoma matsutake 945]